MQASLNDGPLPEDEWPTDDHDLFNVLKEWAPGLLLTLLTELKDEQEQVGHRLKSVFLFIGHIQGKPFLVIGRVILLSN